MKQQLQRKLASHLFITGILIFSSFQAFSTPQDSFKLNLKVGVNIMLGWKSSPSFFYSAGADITYYRNDDWKWITPNMGVSVNFYKGTLGTSVHPDKINDLNIDVIGSAFVSLGDSRKNPFDFQQTENYHSYATNSFYNRYDKYSVTLGSSFIVNNKKRNQQLGHFGFSVYDISLMYFNDGGPIMHQLSLGDKYDRWWTGGLFLSVHPRKWSYSINAAYAVYTGYVKDAYEVSSLMQLNAVIYKEEGQYFLNNGFLSLEIQHDSGFGLGLDFASDKLMFLQNFIHTELRQAHHPSVAPWAPKVRLFYDPVYSLSNFQ